MDEVIAIISRKDQGGEKSVADQKISGPEILRVMIQHPTMVYDIKPIFHCVKVKKYGIKNKVKNTSGWFMASVINDAMYTILNVLDHAGESASRKCGANNTRNGFNLRVSRMCSERVA